VRLAHNAVEKIAALPGDVELDPASRLFFEFAAPLLMTARNEHEFETASSLAEFVWASTHFDAHTQVRLITEFIEETNVSDELVPWLLDVYAELAERKAALLGQ
jgi:uncharacterized protein YozE (UPF0346 family)